MVYLSILALIALATMSLASKGTVIDQDQMDSSLPPNHPDSQPYEVRWQNEIPGTANGYGFVIRTDFPQPGEGFFLGIRRRGGHWPPRHMDLWQVTARALRGSFVHDKEISPFALEKVVDHIAPRDVRRLRDLTLAIPDPQSLPGYLPQKGREWGKKFRQSAFDMGVVAHLPPSVRDSKKQQRAARAADWDWAMTGAAGAGVAGLAVLGEMAYGSNRYVHRMSPAHGGPAAIALAKRPRPEPPVQQEREQERKESPPKHEDPGGSMLKSHSSEHLGGMTEKELEEMPLLGHKKASGKE